MTGALFYTWRTYIRALVCVCVWAHQINDLFLVVVYTRNGGIDTKGLSSTFALAIRDCTMLLFVVVPGWYTLDVQWFGLYRANLVLPRYKLFNLPLPHFLDQEVGDRGTLGGAHWIIHAAPRRATYESLLRRTQNAVFVVGTANALSVAPFFPGRYFAYTSRPHERRKEHGFSMWSCLCISACGSISHLSRRSSMFSVEYKSWKRWN